GGTWVGWTGAPGPASEIATELKAMSRESGYTLVPVPLDEAEVRDFYQGFSNETIWPLFHDFASLAQFEVGYWRTYCQVNRKYARAVYRRADDQAFIWVHDYHLMNLAAELRLLGSRARIGFFLHIPFPSPDIFLKLPWRRPLMQALLEFDLLGFQAPRDRRN